MLYRTLSMFGIWAVLAFLVGCFAYTPDRGEWPVQGTNHLAEGDFSRRFNEGITALYPSTAREESSSLQCQENLFKKFDWDMLTCRNLVALKRELAMREGELK
jgi:hypothetical protein